MDRFLEVKTSLTPPKRGGGEGVPRQLFRAGPGHPHRVNSWTGFFGKNQTPFFPPTPTPPPYPPPAQTRVLGLKLLQLLNCLGPGATPYPPLPPPTFHRGASVSQLFGILPSRLRCSSNHAMRKASFEPTSGFRPFNYALAGSAA